MTHTNSSTTQSTVTSQSSPTSSAPTVNNPPPAPVSLSTSLFLAGVSNCTAAFCTNPIDVLKVRKQIANTGIKVKQYESLWTTVVRIIRNEGYLTFYQGLVPSLLRESTYSAIRLGLYEPYKNYISNHLFPNTDASSSSVASSPSVPFSIRFLAGACSGMTGAILTNPVDILKVRLQARSTGTTTPSIHHHNNTVNLTVPNTNNTTPSQRTIITMLRHELRSMKDELHHIVYQEGYGIRGLWQGSTPNVTRAALLTASQLGSYDTSKTLFQSYFHLKEGILLHFSASMIAGIAAAIITSPVDTVKTRLMIQAAAVMKKNTNYSSKNQTLLSSEILANGMIDSFRTIIRTEGFWGLYKGFHTQWIRIGPHTTITLLVYEQLRKYVGMKPV